MVSFDVERLFTNILLIELCFFATAQTYFSFSGNFYGQIDGLAMGSPLAPVLANLFMSHHTVNFREL